jgi:hypothetical protein
MHLARCQLEVDTFQHLVATIVFREVFYAYHGRIAWSFRVD